MKLKISIPIALEYFINTLMTLVDTIVVTRLGTSAVGAIGAAGVIIDIMQMSIMALNISNTALLSKTIGENNTEKAKKIKPKLNNISNINYNNYSCIFYKSTITRTF